MKSLNMSITAAGMEIGTVEESLKSVQEQLAKKRQYQRELVLKAPRAGLALPPETVDERPDPGGRLSGWSGSALSKKNLGATCGEGTVLCMVGQWLWRLFWQTFNFRM